MMKNPYIVDVVASNEKTLQEVKKAMETFGYFVRLFSHARDFFMEFTSYPSDLVLCSNDLDDASALQIVRYIRNFPDEKKETRVIAFGLNFSSDSRVELYDQGADAFVDGTVPLREFVAIAQAQLRRVITQKQVLRVGAFTLDRVERIAKKNDVPLNLTNCEFLVYQCLMENGGKVVSREELCKTFSDPKAGYDPHSKALDMHIRSLRQKLGPGESHIRSVYGGGYKIVG